MLMAYGYPKMAPAPTMPPGLVELMEDLTKEVLRNNPTDVYDFCAHHMQKLLEIRDGRPKKQVTLEQRISRAKKNIRKKIEERYLKLFDENLEPLASRQDLSKSEVLSGTKVPVHQDKSLQDGGEIEIFPKVTDKSLEKEEKNNILKLDDQLQSDKCLESDIIADDASIIKNDKVVKNIETTGMGIDLSDNENHDAENIKPETIETTINDVTENKNPPNNEDVLETITTAVDDSLPKDDDQIVEKQNFNKNLDDPKQIEIINEPLNAYFTETAITPDFKDSELDVNINKQISPNYNLYASNDSLKNESVDNNTNNETENKMGIDSIKKDVSFISDSEENKESKVQDIKPQDQSEELILQGENMNSKDDVVADKSEKLANSVVDLPIHAKIDSESDFHDNQINSTDKKNANQIMEQEIKNEPIETEVGDNHVHFETISKPLETLSNSQVEEESKINSNLDKNQEIINAPEETDAEGLSTHVNTLVEIHSNSKLEEISMINSNLDIDQDIYNEPKEILQKLDDRHTNTISTIDSKIIDHERNEDTRSEENNETGKSNGESKASEDNISITIIANNDENEGKNINETSQKVYDIENSHRDELNNHPDTEASLSFNQGVEILSEVNTEIEENGKTENKINSAQLEDISKTSKVEADVNSSNYEQVGNTQISSTKRDDEEKEYDLLKDDQGDLSSIISDGSNTHATMNLETAAITIQKVFRNFLFKSRASTFDDAASDESNTQEKEFKDVDFSTLHLPTKDRRPPGLGRMDTMLQTVNEEKSLSLSTDDSSTISSAATIIQAHVRGFLARNKWNSSKTISSNSRQNSNPSNPVSTETQDQQNKSKTVLNIHIVPESGHFISREDSVLASMDLSLDSSPPTSTNLHPLSHDVSERRKLLKREDAIQSVSPPSNNSGKLSEDAESIKELPLNETNTSKNLTNNEKHDLGEKTEEKETKKLTNDSLEKTLHIDHAIKESADKIMTIKDTTEKPSSYDGKDVSRTYNSDQNADDFGPSCHETLENKSYNQSGETTPTSSLTSDTVIEAKKDNVNFLENDQISSSNAALENENKPSFKDARTVQEILTNDANQITNFICSPEQDTVENIPNVGNNELTPTPTTSLTSETVTEVKRGISESNDAGDVIIPVKEKKNEITVETKLLHSGEFHDIVLPTKVSRSETSVIREFKNVVVYFLLWNNA